MHSTKSSTVEVNECISGLYNDLREESMPLLLVTVLSSRTITNITGVKVRKIASTAMCFIQHF